MVARPGQYQASFNAGEISPDAHGNTGLKSYYSGAARMLGVLPVPQGGFRLAPRTRLASELRRPLSLVYQLLTLSFTAQYSGDSFGIDMGAVRTVSAVDLTGYYATVSGARPLKVQFLDVATGVWTDIGGPVTLPLASGATTRRFAFPPGVSIQARYARIILVASLASLSTIYVPAFYVFSEASSGTMPHRSFAFSKSTVDTYVATMMGGHVDFWKNGVYAGCVNSPIGQADIATVCVVQRDETAFLIHPDYPTTRLLRHSLDHDWSFETIPWSHVPDVRYDGVYPDTAESWLLSFNWPTTGYNPVGTTFTISVGGESTDPILLQGSGSAVDMAATAAGIKLALENLAGVEPGILVTTGALVTGSAWFGIFFQGVGNAGANFDLTGIVTSTTQAALRLARTLKGKSGGEPLFSTTRGHAACGMFYQDRFITGGFRSKGSAFAASRTGEYFDLNIELSAATAAILANLDTDNDERLIHMAHGRHAIFFTNAAHYYVADRAITATNPPNIVRSERVGVSARTRPVEQDDAIFFMNQAESVLCQMVYDDVAQGYRSSPLSLLSSHLVRGISGMALQRASKATDADLLWMVRDDGGMTIASLIRGQDVSAFTDWITDGAVKTVSVDASNVVWLTIERVVSGVARTYLEKVDSDALLDATVTVVNGADSTIIGGLYRHEGKMVWAIADGWPVGPFLVSGGFIDVRFVATTIEVGLWTAPVATTMPLPRNVAERQVLKRPARVHTVRADVIGTQSIAIAANGGAANDVATLRSGGPVDLPPEQVTREIVVTGLAGFSQAGQVTITQTRPGRLQIRNLTLEARI